ncbi:putative WD-40 repeat-containing protein [Triangularia verruculosa]|uniref:WD-40 repeat-containing protein n=1 Tax=Triangularia verruculosa TaxID=2587418 RepID=A0AAN6X8S4_9PEZI|nr:putative WD-40 repeat-containing protein [Triangularia verruculosa]
MAGFASQTDEGYSEDPLTAICASASFSHKSRDDSVSALGSSQQTASDFPAWMIQHISNLSISRKTELAMALLNDLPTTVISQIVEQLNPRLYIDFIRYLPPEVCLKILGYLDPLSLINVARSCRAWYDLALDRKLWEQLYYMEGWKAKPHEIAAWEKSINGTSSRQGVSRRVDSETEGHAHKKRAIAVFPTLDVDMDSVMLDAGAVKQEPAEMDASESSLFGGPRASTDNGSISRKLDELDVHSNSSAGGSGSGYATKSSSIDKGKGRALSSESSSSARSKGNFLDTVLATPLSRLPRSTLWILDPHDRRYKLNWKHLYTMRRRLESNWDLGKYTNFQLPHPNHPEEGHGECIYSLQFNPQYLVSGSRDRTLKVWDMETRRCLRTLAQHRGSVLCLQFDSDPDEDIIVSGSSDSDVIIWRFSTGKVVQTLKYAHRESVLNVKFDKRILVTCSKDKLIKVFNRRPLRSGDLGYRDVSPVPTTINYGYNIPMAPEDLPQTPEWTLIGTLEGHSAAVNAVQIHDREVVSASGDRHIKVWDWPTQTCSRTIVGHTKGIACVQYDGRRIVSGSSDHEVKVFDRSTGLEVASLRSHSALVRTVQAGFGDLPFQEEDDAEAAKKVDEDYFKALEAGLLDESSRPKAGRRQGNAGSRKPEDICAYGAKLPPGGGGGKYGRIVSGSYDTSIIIWRRDKEGIWKDQQHLKQEEAAAVALRDGRTILQGFSNFVDAAAAIPLHPSVRPGVQQQPGSAASTANASHPTQTASAPPSTSNGPTTPPTNRPDPEQVRVLIDEAIQAGAQAFTRAIGAHPVILTQRQYIEGKIDRLQNAVTRSQLRQAFSGAMIRAQFEQTRLRREAQRNAAAMAAAATAAAGPSSSQQNRHNAEPAQATASSSTATATAMATTQPPPRLTPAQQQAAAAYQAHAALASGGHGRVHQVLLPAPSSTPAPAPAPVPVPIPVPTTTARPVPIPVPVPVPVPVQAHHHHHHHHAPIEGHDAANPARVFKLQYDARRIICCSQTSVIVGWDFCNSDKELEQAAQFFGTVE